MIFSWALAMTTPGDTTMARLSEVEKVCDRVASIREGRARRLGP